MPWETNNVRARGQFRDKYASSADTWAIEPQGINQVGCIFSIQGFEIDYIGVILGPDIQYDAENDVLIGQVGNNVAVQSSDSQEYTRHIRNAYRVLMSRGKKGCFVYCCNSKGAEFLERCQRKQVEIIEMNTTVPIAAEKGSPIRTIILDDYDFQRKSNKVGFIPLYSVRAACGYFEDDAIPEVEGWVDASGHGFKPDPKIHFIVHAKGDSMLPKIHDGDLCVFEWYHSGSRNGEIVLTQCCDYDPDYDGKYTIKKYYSEKVITKNNWSHTKIELKPINPNYDSIELDPEENYKTIGVFKCLIQKIIEALIELFPKLNAEDTPVVVGRIVADIDSIVKVVRFPGWQSTNAGEREVQKALRKTLLKYKLHKEEALFNKAYMYIREYY